MLDRLSNEDIMREYTLGNIIRYNNRIRLANESVAEHTCFVSVFCLKILAQIRSEFVEILDMDKLERDVLVLATLHDMAESRTSDIPHNVKTAYPEIDKILLRIENDYYEECWSYYAEDVINANEFAFSILKLADAYSVMQYCMNEQSLGNVSRDVAMILLDAEKRVRDGIANVNVYLKEAIRLDEEEKNMEEYL